MLHHLYDDKKQKDKLHFLENRLNKSTNLLNSYLNLCDTLKNVNEKNYKEIVEKFNEMKNETCIFLNKENDNSLVELPVIKIVDIDKNIIGEFQKFKEGMKKMMKTYNKNEIPNINISLIIDFINKFSKFLQFDDFIEEYNNKGSVLISENHEIPLKFESGDKIILTTKNFDLSYFTVDQLKEILRVIDILAKDERFDHLRKEITKQIIAISSIEKIK